MVPPFCCFYRVILRIYYELNNVASTFLVIYTVWFYLFTMHSVACLFLIHFYRMFLLVYYTQCCLGFSFYFCSVILLIYNAQCCLHFSFDKFLVFYWMLQKCASKLTCFKHLHSLIIYRLFISYEKEIVINKDSISLKFSQI